MNSYIHELLQILPATKKKKQQQIVFIFYFWKEWVKCWWSKSKCRNIGRYQDLDVPHSLEVAVEESATAMLNMTKTLEL